MKIAIRLDDITPMMDWPKFYRFKAILDKYGIKPLIGVIPDCRDEKLNGSGEGAPADFWKYVREELVGNGWQVAMHGMYHVYTTKEAGMFPLNDFSEFAGVPYDTQLEMIKKGRQILSENGIKTGLFMAPGHSFDVNTLKALNKCGFRALTDSFGVSPFEYKGMGFYPIAFKRSIALRHREIKGYTTFVVHTNTLTDKDYKYYNEILGKKRSMFIDYSQMMSAPMKSKNYLTYIFEYWLANIKRIGKNLLKGK